MPGQVHSIFISRTESGPMEPVEEVRAVPGLGLEGDRYFMGSGTFSKKKDPSRELTLIEKEAIDAIGEDGVVIGLGESRRNIVTSGVALNHLVGKEFRIGDVRARGLRLCEPCGHLEEMTKPGVKDGLIHRGGLRAQILTEGVVRPGDPVGADS